ncbi:MAG: 30S ribosomal protein S12 methylthiotransferase RimO [Clostridia bacterium]|nr:30S ribosomal protein S12 methylthiotransferase RimO [Clostridia bacterium]
MRIKVGVVSLGCDKNRVDSEVMLGNLANEYEIVNLPQAADVIIVNTCAFIERARKESVDVIFEMNAYKKEGRKLIITGCLPSLYKQGLADELVEADAVLGIGEYDDICSIVQRVVEGERIVRFDSQKLCVGQRLITTPPHYCYLKIADGCNNCCAYCTIPAIRGKYRSIDIDTLVAEARGLVSENGTELILVAQDVTKYGVDLYGKKRLVELIHRLSALEGVQIRLLYCYPELIDDALIAEMKSNPKLLKYLDIPMQHASDRVLKAMNRRSSNTELKALIARLRHEIPEIALRSTFIVGFPGETEEEFKELLDFVDYAELTNVGFFAYSREENTPAGRMEGQIADDVKQARLERAYLTQKNVVRRCNHNMVGKIVEVVVEDKDKGVYSGRCYAQAPEIDGKTYFTSAKKLSEGERVNVLIESFFGYDLRGKTV